MSHESPAPTEHQDRFGDHRWPFENVPENAEKASAEIAEAVRQFGWSGDQVEKIRNAVHEAFVFAGRHSDAGKEIWIALDPDGEGDRKVTVTLKYDNGQAASVPTESEVFHMAADADTGSKFSDGEIVLPFKKEE